MEYNWENLTWCKASSIVAPMYAAIPITDIIFDKEIKLLNSLYFSGFDKIKMIKITGKINKGIETYQEALWNGISCTGETFTKKKSLKIS